jgi:hypothetical protein
VRCRKERQEESQQPHNKYLHATQAISKRRRSPHLETSV